MRLAAVAFAFALSLGSAHATTLIDFDSFTAMSNSPGASVPVAARLSNQLLASDGVSFSSGAGYVAVVDHIPGCTSCTPTPFNIIGGTAAGDTLSYSTPITAAFFSTANTSVKATTNFVQVLGDWVPLGSGVATLEAYNAAGVLIGSISDPDVSAPGHPGPFLSLSLPGIHSVRFYSDNATVGFDNFEFGDLTAVNAVPEPANWALLIAGFGIAGAALRRKRTLATA